MSERVQDFFDERYYSVQAGRGFCSKAAAFRHFVREGQHRGLDPHRYFSTEWYQWQNPGWEAEFSDPFTHFLSVGVDRNSDPSFLVDLVQFRRSIGNRSVLDTLFRQGGWPSSGVYHDLSVLRLMQRRFMSCISPVPLNVRERPRRRPNLVHLQAGGSEAGRRLCGTESRSYDVLVNYYDACDVDPHVGEYSIFQVGTKFTAAYLNLSRFPDIYRDYRYVLFLDDDISASPSQLTDIFTLCERNGLALAQASLTGDSYCVWPALYQKHSKGVRMLNAVEIMMPVMSAEVLAAWGHHFRESVSGFGLDLLFGSLVEKDKKKAIAVLDDVALKHGKPIDAAGGAYYEFLRSNFINPKAELWGLIRRYGLDREIRERPGM